MNMRQFVEEQYAAIKQTGTKTLTNEDVAKEIITAFEKEPEITQQIKDALGADLSKSIQAKIALARAYKALSEAIYVHLPVNQFNKTFAFNMDCLTKEYQYLNGYFDDINKLSTHQSFPTRIKDDLRYALSQYMEHIEKSNMNDNEKLAAYSKAATASKKVLAVIKLDSTAVQKYQELRIALYTQMLALEQRNRSNNNNNPANNNNNQTNNHSNTANIDPQHELNLIAIMYDVQSEINDIYTEYSQKHSSANSMQKQKLLELQKINNMVLEEIDPVNLLRTLEDKLGKSGDEFNGLKGTNSIGLNYSMHFIKMLELTLSLRKSLENRGVDLKEVAPANKNFISTCEQAYTDKSKKFKEKIYGRNPIEIFKDEVSRIIGNKLDKYTGSNTNDRETQKLAALKNIQTILDSKKDAHSILSEMQKFLSEKPGACIELDALKKCTFSMKQKYSTTYNLLLAATFQLRKNLMANGYDLSSLEYNTEFDKAVDDANIKDLLNKDLNEEIAEFESKNSIRK